MDRRRVVITGAGSINALGHSVPDTFVALRENRCGIGPLDLPDLDRLSIRIGAQVRNWRAENHFTPRELALFDRATQFALWAAQEAIAQSGWLSDDAASLRTGVILGTAGGGLGTIDDNYRAVYAQGKSRVPPLTVPRLMANAAAAQLAMRHGAKGPSFTVSSACASSNHAMGLAMQMIRSGMADVMLTGGADAMLCFGGLKAWEGLRVMSPVACKPFSANRSGLVQGEGAAVFVFEERAHALARGATILAEVAGFGMTSDAHDIVMPDPQGAARAMRLALEDAGLQASQIGYLNAHGTGTTANDRSESRAIRDVFGDLSDDLAVSSTKGAHGHCMGASGAVELLACLLALKDGVIAANLGYDLPDPDCDLNIVGNLARRDLDLQAVLSNAFAFGGMNAVLALIRA